jgi:hypothetical protein
MSAFSAAIAVRRYTRDNPEVSFAEAAEALRRSDADLAGADFRSGLMLVEILPDELDFSVPTVGIRLALGFLIENLKPWWTRFFPAGRQRLLAQLSEAEVQCFRSAGLLADPPSVEVADWWYRFAALVRAEQNDKRTEQGRAAEMLSLDYERARLKGLGIDLEPKWIAIEDNGAGYDIKSYDPGPFEPVSRLIEVKSTTSIPPRIILTRGEWEAAVVYGAALSFHLWELRQNKLTVLSVEQMRAHVPVNVGQGEWLQVEIELDL